jgi:hypothetical protein
VNGRFLVAATNSNALFLWDVSRYDINQSYIRNVFHVQLVTCRREAKWLQRHKNWSSGGDCRITGVSCSIDGKYAALSKPNVIQSVACPPPRAGT